MTALVPMRSGSKGLPHKNIKDFLGKPLFYWNIKALLDAGAEVWISTDSQKYALMVNEYFGVYVNVFYRSKKTASDTATTWDVVKEFIEKRKIPDDEILLVCQVTSPYLTAELAKNCAYLSERYHDSVRTVGVTKRYFYTADTPLNHSFPHKPRQGECPTLVENGCLYAASVKWMRANNCYHNETTYNQVMGHAWELDTPADWAYGEEAMRE